MRVDALDNYSLSGGHGKTDRPYITTLIGTLVPTRQPQELFGALPPVSGSKLPAVKRSTSGVVGTSQPRLQVSYSQPN